MSGITVKILDAEYPVKFGHHALVKMLKLAEMTKYTDILTIIQDFPAEKAPEAVLALIENGIKVTGDKLKTPKITAIEAEMDRNVVFWFNVIEQISGELEVPEAKAEGN